MKWYFAVVAFVTGVCAPPLEAADYADSYAGLLAKYVKPDGVRYAAWKANAADLAALDAIVESIAGAQVSESATKENLCFYLNAYNAWILHEMLGKYPVEGPLAISPHFFHAKRITVAGEKMSFDTLEQKIIRPRFGEARIHFALNCASTSCPPLAAGPFSPAGLDAQLDRLAAAFINSERGVRDGGGGMFALSRIFDWYAEDFVKSAGSVQAFINRYRKPPLPDGAKTTIQDYQWTLNEVR